jgi:DNA-binding beta-propeller fold protein YncE
MLRRRSRSKQKAKNVGEIEKEKDEEGAVAKTALRLVLICIVIFVSVGTVARILRKTHGAETRPANDVLRLVADAPLTGPAVRFDYQSLDASTGLLYIAHMNAGQLVVFDVGKREVLRTLDGFHGVHGVIAVPEEKRVYASVTDDHEVAVVDQETLGTVARVGTIRYPDGLAYAPGPRRLFVSDEHGDADVVIDVRSNTVLKKIPLGGGAGNTVYDRGGGKILVAVHGKNELVLIDPVTMEITQHVALPGISDPHGIALDTENRLAFVAGEGNHQMAVLDLNTMQINGKYTVGRDPDVLAFDPGKKRLYVAAESGQVTVFREDNRNVVFLGGMDISHAHTVAVDPRTHLVYFPLQNVEGKPILRIMEWAGTER